MALTLRGSVNATQTYMEVSGSDDLVADTIKALDDEYVYVRSVSDGTPPYGQGAWRQISVTRGFLGKAAASHSLGTTVAAVDVGTGGGGVVVDNGVDAPAAVTTLVAPGAAISDSTATLPLQFRQLGPVRVTFATPGLVDSGVGISNGVVIFDDLPLGSIVLKVFACAVNHDWDAGLLNLHQFPNTLALYNMSAGAASGADYAVEAFPFDLANNPPTAAITGTASVAYSPEIRAVVVDGIPTSGEADIYAIIAVPAA